MCFDLKMIQEECADISNDEAPDNCWQTTYFLDKKILMLILPKIAAAHQAYDRGRIYVEFQPESSYAICYLLSHWTLYQFIASLKNSCSNLLHVPWHLFKLKLGHDWFGRKANDKNTRRLMTPFFVILINMDCFGTRKQVSIHQVVAWKLCFPLRKYDWYRSHTPNAAVLGMSQWCGELNALCNVRASLELKFQNW